MQRTSGFEEFAQSRLHDSAVACALIECKVVHSTRDLGVKRNAQASVGVFFV
jgi:hypothetical protein